MNDFDKALKALPTSAGYDAFAHETVEDLCYIFLHELDLVVEQEYWRPLAERKRLLKFIEKFGKACDTDYTNEARRVFTQALAVSRGDCYINE